MVCTSLYCSEFHNFQVKRWWMGIITSTIAIITIYSLFCYPSVARRVPYNYILLFIFTICEGYCVSWLAANYGREKVFIATSITGGIVIGLTLYACFAQTNLEVIFGLFFVITFSLPIA